jgi:hypothetical protein
VTITGNGESEGASCKLALKIEILKLTERQLREATPKIVQTPAGNQQARLASSNFAILALYSLGKSERYE